MSNMLLQLPFDQKLENSAKTRFENFYSVLVKNSNHFNCPFAGGLKKKLQPWKTECEKFGAVEGLRLKVDWWTWLVCCLWMADEEVAENDEVLVAWGETVVRSFLDIGRLYVLCRGDQPLSREIF